MSSGYIAAIAGGALGALLTGLAALFKYRSERGNLTVDSAQKAVLAMSEVMDELRGQLERVTQNAAQLEKELDEARDRVRELTEHAAQLEQEIAELRQRLAS